MLVLFDLSCDLGQDAELTIGQQTRSDALLRNPYLHACLAMLLSVQGCASSLPPRPYFEQDQYGRYYETERGHIFRVDDDGTILDVTCTDPDLAKGLPREDLLRVLCASGTVTVVGKATRYSMTTPMGPVSGKGPAVIPRTGQTGSTPTNAASSPDWDLSAYAIAPESGRCEPLFAPLSDAWTAQKRRSCAHRIWEVPAALVAYPTIGAVVLGVATAPVWLPLLIFSKK